MAAKQNLQVVVGSQMFSLSNHYEVQDILGSGTFGLVAECRKFATNEIVAIKVIKDRKHIKSAKKEMIILKRMKELNSDQFNIVRWNDSFTFKGHFCLEFEKLDMNLHEFLWRSRPRSLKLAEIRPIVHQVFFHNIHSCAIISWCVAINQLATALEFLKTVGIVHADLKPENIMMVDHVHQPLRVKIIDFGLAVRNPAAWTGVTLQTLWYRAPEVLLGTLFDEAIDTWSLGCIAAEMLLGEVLFCGGDTYDMMRHIVCTIGQPPERLLADGLHAQQYFCSAQTGVDPPLWRLMTSLEVGNFTCQPPTVISLNELKMSHQLLHQASDEEALAGFCDRLSFVDLLKKMLTVDPAERITPEQILQHPFITMSHFAQTFDNSPYLKMSKELMSVVSTDDAEDEDQANPTVETSSSSASHDAPEVCHPVGPSGREQPHLRSPNISGETPPTRKRWCWDSDDLQRSNNSLDPTPTKKRRNESPALTEAGGKSSPVKTPLHKTGSHDAVSCRASGENSPAKKWRSVNLDEELTDSAKEALSSSEGSSGASLTPVDNIKKRKRADDEASGFKEEKSSPVRRERSLDGGEG